MLTSRTTNSVTPNLETTVNNNDTQITNAFTTAANFSGTGPGRVVFESGSNSVGFSVVLDTTGKLAVYSNNATSTPRAISETLSVNTSYTLVLEFITSTLTCNLHYNTGSNYDWFIVGRPPDDSYSLPNGDICIGGDRTGVARISDVLGGYSPKTSGPNYNATATIGTMFVYSYPL